jgi:hypothetical protein
VCECYEAVRKEFRRLLPDVMAELTRPIALGLPPDPQQSRQLKAQGASSLSWEGLRDWSLPLQRPPVTRGCSQVQCRHRGHRATKR